MHRYTCFGAYILNHDKLIINHYALSSSVTVRILSRAGMRTHLYLIRLESPLLPKVFCASVKSAHNMYPVKLIGSTRLAS
jgi:hypothetical protein